MSHINTDKLKARLNASPLFNNFGEDGQFIKDFVLELLDEESKNTSDNIVEIVRCKECKFWADHKSCPPFENLRKCYRQYGAAMGENDYCSLGEKGERLYG